MGYNFPMPFLPIVPGWIANISLMVAVWLGFPSELRSHSQFRKRLTSFLLYLAISFTIFFQHIFIDVIWGQLWAYENQNGVKVQWLLAFILPVCRGFYGWILPKVFNKAAGHENEAAGFFLETFIGCKYAFFVTVRMVNANDFVTYWIVAVEFCINLGYALQLILMHSKVQGNAAEEIQKWKNKKQAILRNLVTMEGIEILIPLAYSMGYTTAYYGPNARNMVGVKCAYFGNTEKDIRVVLGSVSQLAELDAYGAIVIGILLGLLCQINIVDEFCIIMKKHWISLTLLVGSNMNFVRNIIYNYIYNWFYL